MTAENFRRVMAVNVEGTFNAIQASIPHLIESKGYFLAVASMAAAVAPPGLAAYGASKGATENLTNTFRAEMAHLGVDVGIAYFSWIATDLVKTGNEHPAFAYMRTHLPGPLKAVSPEALAVDALISGVLRRKRRVLAPGWLRLVMALRWFVAGDPSPYKTQMPELERLFAEEAKKAGSDRVYMSDPTRG